MINAQTSPDLGLAYYKHKLKGYIKANTHPGMFAEVCKANVDTDPSGVFKMIAEQIRDNRVLLIEQFGERVVILVEQLKF